MKKLSFLMAALLVAMTGCQKEPVGGNTNALDGDVYMSFSVQLPETKSQTNTDGGDTYVSSTDGTEVGAQEENEINNISVFLYDSESSTTIFAQEVAQLTGSSTVYTATFQKEKLENVNDVTYEVYVVCNESLSGDLDLNKTYTLSTDNITSNIAQDNSFLMTNAHKTEVTVTASHDWSKNMTPGTAFNLGNVEVERAVARFDYAAKETDNTYVIPENTYKVQLTDVALINMSKEFYYFRRVAADANAGTAVEVGGVEIQTNYVVDTDWAAKRQHTTGSVWNTALNTNFFYHLTTDPTYESLTTIASNDEDNAAWTGNLNEYHVWRYVTENTIPGLDNQVNGISTGVIFKGQVVDNAGTPVKGSENAYVFNNVFYNDWNAVETAAATDPKLQAAYDHIDAIATPAKTDYTAAGFTVYAPNIVSPATEGNYEVLYYYWNRHNNNDQNTVMGPMEFAVVRNNVYKLAVSSISKFGHPTDPEGDPDPVEPTDKDETAEYYFTVSVKVLPWTVRVNDIEF